MKKYISFAICLAICTPLLMGCGKKPAQVKAPPHVEQDPYPITYPAKDPIPKI